MQNGCPLSTYHSLDIFSKNSQISYATKIRPVGAELFQADGRTDGCKHRHV